MSMDIIQRPRRNRKSENVRKLTEENSVDVSDLILPVFLLPGENDSSQIASMPGMERKGINHVLKEIENCMNLGVFSFALFPAVPDSLKDSTASYASRKDNFYLNAVRRIKKEFTDSVIITDTAMDPYSSDGHDGYVENGKIINDRTLEILGDMAAAQAEAGADMIGPSDMMDGRVGFIRERLDLEGYHDTSIISYAAKYASAFYGPFRDALDSAPKFGDKKTYQMNPANAREAELEAELDFMEGADILMVKPGLPYLDIIYRIKEKFRLPVAAYQVSGEYSMIRFGAKAGILDEKRAVEESLLCMKRAGADMILTYFAKQFAENRKR